MARHKDFLVEKKRVNKCNLSVKCGSIKDVAAAFAQIMELTMPSKMNTWKFSRFTFSTTNPKLKGKPSTDLHVYVGAQLGESLGCIIIVYHQN